MENTESILPPDSKTRTTNENSKSKEAFLSSIPNGTQTVRTSSPLWKIIYPKTILPHNPVTSPAKNLPKTDASRIISCSGKLLKFMSAPTMDDDKHNGTIDVDVQKEKKTREKSFTK